MMIDTFKFQIIPMCRLAVIIATHGTDHKLFTHNTGSYGAYKAGLQISQSENTGIFLVFPSFVAHVCCLAKSQEWVFS